MEKKEFTPSRVSLSLIKTGLVKNKGKFDEALGAFENEVGGAGLFIVARKFIDLSMVMPDEKTLCEHFYAVHKDEPFFEDLKKKQEGLVLALVIAATKKGGDAIGPYRDLIGATDPNDDRRDNKYTLRARFGESKALNGFHGSDGRESALYEIKLLWTPREVEDYFSEYL